MLRHTGEHPIVGVNTFRIPHGDPVPGAIFEEWDEPRISAICWVSELVGIAGGDDIFPGRAAASLGTPSSRAGLCGQPLTMRSTESATLP